MNLGVIHVNRNKENNNRLHHLTLDDIEINDIKPNENRRGHRRRNLDPDQLKSIYESAYIFTLLYGYAKESDRQAGQSAPVRDAQTDTNTDKIKEKVLDFLSKQANEKSSQQPHDVTMENIWNVDELDVLRNHFDAVKQDSIIVKSKLLVVEKENQDLRKENQSLISNLNSVNKEKHEVQLTNDRLSIRIEQIERELTSKFKENEILRANAKLGQEKLLADRKQIQTLTETNYKLDFQGNQYANKLEAIRTELKCDFDLLLDKLNFEHGKQIRDLAATIKDLKHQLELEKNKNNKTETALKHLRSHFLADNPNTCNSHKLNDKSIKLF
jgi:hypothetical protein